MIRIVINREVASGNSLAYQHWRARTKDRKAWESWILFAKSQMPAAQKIAADGHRYARIISFRCRILDDDNLSSGAKHLRDSLVRAGFLKDDNRQWSTWHYVQRLRSHHANPDLGQSCTVVEIDEHPLPPEE